MSLVSSSLSRVTFSQVEFSRGDVSFNDSSQFRSPLLRPAVRLLS